MAGVTRASGTPMRRPPQELRRFEIYVGKGFSEYEVAAIARTLKEANAVLAQTLFSWRYISHTPGLLSGECGMILRAEPALDNHDLSDAMLVVGGKSGTSASWLARLRQMQRIGRPVALLSDAATAYIRNTKAHDGPVTTHWRDALALAEDPLHANLSNRLSEINRGIVTAGGSGATEELVIGMIADDLGPNNVTELGNRLLLALVRKSHAEQPFDLTHNPALHDSRVRAAITEMQDTLDAPLQIAELAREIGLSTRHLERVFKEVFNETPAKFYKRLRTNRARAMIEETQMPIVEIAIANGFGTSGSLSEAIKREYGMTATRLRARGQGQVLSYKP
ncbi:GlxA family transcriptional regulator [Planktotalea arctica]|uniref:GlxA family transcriptional regulator n=1 Tax=Planktotalea arctica TaxID=1481893 RepID=UPI001FE4E53A|nr:helix-turn-helix domain-containing protein [Planktotalea arctica]